MSGSELLPFCLCGLMSSVVHPVASEISLNPLRSLRPSRPGIPKKHKLQWYPQQPQPFFFLALLFPRKSMVPQKVSGVDCYCRIPETNKALETSSGHVRPWNKQKHAKTTRTKQPVDPAYDKSAGLRMWTCSRSLPDILAPIFNGFWLHTRNAIFVDQDL